MSLPLSAGGIAALCVCAMLCTGLGFLCVRVLNRVPAKWLCDYGEQPSRELLAGVRFPLLRTGAPCAVVLALCGAGCVFVYGVSLYSALLILVLCMLLLTALGDGKYTIIPDQFTVLTGALCLAAGYTDLFTKQVFISSWYQPLLGALSGFLLLFLIDLLCRAVAKKDGFGFGDVKLMAALGALFGFPTIFLAFFFAVLTALVHIIILFFAGKAKNGSYLPMGPYICTGCTLLLLFSGPVGTAIRMYMSLFGISL